MMRQSAQMIELLDIQDAMPAARRLRDWAIKKAAVRPWRPRY
jgi:hypothetical protein